MLRTAKLVFSNKLCESFQFDLIYGTRYKRIKIGCLIDADNVPIACKRNDGRNYNMEHQLQNAFMPIGQTHANG
jgi:hypothetical protein